MIANDQLGGFAYLNITFEFYDRPPKVISKIENVDLLLGTNKSIYID